MNRAIKHHYIPRSIIRRFANSEGRFYCYNIRRLENKVGEESGEDNLYCVNNLNSIFEDGNLSDVYEKYFTQKFDTPVSEVTEKLLENENNLSVGDYEFLKLFCLMLVHRHPIYMNQQDSPFIHPRSKKPVQDNQDIPYSQLNWAARAHLIGVEVSAKNLKVLILKAPKDIDFLLADSYIEKTPSNHLKNYLHCIVIHPKYAIQIIQNGGCGESDKIFEISSVDAELMNRVAICKANNFIISRASEPLKNIDSNSFRLFESEANEVMYGMKMEGYLIPVFQDAVDKFDVLYFAGSLMNSSEIIQVDKHA